MTMQRPLEGIRVLDLTVALAGPYGSLLLAGLGAEVIRVESPDGGDIARTNPPHVGKNGIHFGAPEEGDVSLTILNRARNKKSVTLNLKSPEGRRLFLELAKQADVVIENMSEGATVRLGVAYEDVAKVNPRIVYASIKAFGEPSIYPGLKGMDVLAQALSGIMDVTGFKDGPPTRFGLPIADLLAPLYACNGILAALIQRGRTGQGQHIQVSMLDCLASLVAEEHFDVSQAAGYPVRSGNSQDRLVPFGVYPTRDGHAAIAGFNPVWFRGLLEAMGRQELLDDPRFASRGPRMKHADELNALIEDWTSGYATVDLLAELGSRGVPSVPVRTAVEVLNDPRLRERGAVVELEHPSLGKIGATGMGLPIHFSACKVGFDQPAMDLGAANAAVFGALLGASDSQLAEWKQSGVI
ncbi:MAG: CoA transferase [Sphingobium sp.]|nr:MAG: CoA transferase [Sphingobium sp.]